MTRRVPAASVRLTIEEWGLVMAALGAYRHNTTYRTLYQKLAAEAAPVSRPWTLT